MTTNQQTLLSRYQYDPLDRLADCESTGQTATRRFYLKDRLTTEIQGSVQHSMFQHDDQLLAQQLHENDAVETALLATDQQRSVLQLLDATQPHPLAYTPYGHRPGESGLLSLLGFNGERPDPVTGYYLLGNGYRAFNSVLMRFNSPDNLSPFGKGGLNAYAYCKGNPVNSEDPSGHTPVFFLKSLLTGLGIMKKSPRPATTASTVPLSSSGADILYDSGAGRVVERTRRTLSPSSSENNLHDLVRLHKSRIQLIKSEADRLRVEIDHLDSMIKNNVDSGAEIVPYGESVQKSRELDQRLAKMNMEILTVGENLRAEANQLNMEISRLTEVRTFIREGH